MERILWSIYPYLPCVISVLNFLERGAVSYTHLDVYKRQEYNRNLYALWPRLSYTYNTNNMVASTWFLRDGSFLRLKSVELGYSVPKRWSQALLMDNLRFYFNGINLLTLSKFKLWDPEMGGNGLGYPVQKVLNFGLQISF